MKTYAPKKPEWVTLRNGEKRFVNPVVDENGEIVRHVEGSKADNKWDQNGVSSVAQMLGRFTSEFDIVCPYIGDDYELVSGEQLVQQGDEFWEPNTRTWRTARNRRTIPFLIYRRKKAPQIDPGEGYRLLGPDEQMIEGDEIRYTDNDRWFKAAIYKGITPRNCGVVHAAVRRKFTEPGPGYRLLGPDETLQSGDESKYPYYGGWHLTQSHSWGRPVSYYPRETFRRPVEDGYTIVSGEKYPVYLNKEKS